MRDFSVFVSINAASSFRFWIAFSSIIMWLKECVYLCGCEYIKFGIVFQLSF